MHIYVGKYPQEKLYDGKVDPDITISELIQTHLKKSADDESILVIDRNQNFHRITVDDAVCRHYNGKPGEIFRITDGSAVRYRVVVPSITLTKEKAKPKEKRVSDSIYASAYENILTMLQDRGCDPELVAKFSIPRDQLLSYYQSGAIQSLTIPGLEPTDPQLIDSRGRAVYVFFLSPDKDVIISRRGTDYRAVLVSYMNDVIKHHNSVKDAGEPDMAQLDVGSLQVEDDVRGFAEKFEIIIVHNNPTGKGEYDVGINPKFHQTFAVQNLSFVVTRHVDQPIFVLLNPQDPDHRKEIRHIYAQNGRMLEGDKKLSSYGLRDGVRLILI